MRNTSLLIMLTFVLSNCKEKIAEVESASQEILNYTIVEVADVEISNDPIPVYAIGHVASDEEVKLSFKIGGIISGLSADEGDYVKQGAQLASIRTTEIDAQVLKAQRALQKARRDLDRVQKMHEEQAATLENVQDLTTLVEVSKADLDIAQFNQKYAKIISPVNGRILRKLAENEELVSPGQPIFIIASSQKSQVVKVSLSDRDITQINYGDKAKIFFDAYPNTIFEGSVLQISESSDPRTGTFEVDLRVNKKGKRLRNGYIGRIEILPRQVSSYYKIPIDALVEGNDELLTVFIPEKGDSVAHEVALKPDFIGENYFTVERSEDLVLDRVITSGAPYLLDKDKIKVK